MTDALSRIEAKIDILSERVRKIELRWAAVAGASGVIGGVIGFVIEMWVK